MKDADRLAGRAGNGKERRKDDQRADHDDQFSPSSPPMLRHRDAVDEPLLNSDKSIASPIALYPASLGCR